MDKEPGTKAIGGHPIEDTDCVARTVRKQLQKTKKKFKVM